MLSPEDKHNMEQLIISAMTNDGEYPVENVGEHAEQIAGVLIFNGYQLAKAHKKVDRPEKVAEVICEACMPYVCAHWELHLKERLVKCKALREWTDRIALIPDEIRAEVLRELDACIDTRLTQATESGASYDAGKVAGLRQFRQGLKGGE